MARTYGSGIQSNSDAKNPGSTVLVLAASSTPVAAANPARAEITIVNDGANPVYLRLSDTGAVINSGIRLNANGGAWTSSAYTGAISARASVGDTAVVVVEV